MKHLTLSKKSAGALTLGLVLSVPFIAVGQTQNADETRELPPGQTLERQMTGAETHRYLVTIRADEFFQVRVEQKGVDVALKLVDAKGNTLATMDSPNGEEGPETLSFVAARNDSYWLEVSKLEAKLEMRYTIRREAARAATPEDKRRVEVEHAFVEGMAALAIKGQSETAIARLTEALRGWRELKDVYLTELTAQQVSLLRDPAKRAQASASFKEGEALFGRPNKQSRRAAITKFAEARRMFSEMEDRHNEAVSLDWLGSVYAALGDKRKALEYYNQALPLTIALDDKHDEAMTLNYIGLAYMDLGEIKAIECFQQALPLSKAIDDKQGEASALHNLGTIYARIGETERALGYYEQALLLRHALGEKAAEALTLTNIGLAYNNLGEPGQALDYYLRALPLYTAADTEEKAATSNNMGTAYLDLGMQQKALEYYSQAFVLFRSVDYGTGTATALNNIGAVYLSLDDAKRALEYYNRALPLRIAVGDREGEAGTLNNIGGIYSKSGEKQKALEYYIQALSLYKAIGDRRDEATIFSNMMVAWESLNNRRLAILYGKQSVNDYQSLRADIKGLAKELQKSFVGSVEHTYRKLAELLIRENRIPEAEQILRMLKEEEYFAFVRRDGRVVASLDERINLNPAEKDATEQFETISLELGRIYREIEAIEKEKGSASGAEDGGISGRQMELNKKLEVSSSKLNGFLVELSKDFATKDSDSTKVEQSSQAIVKEWHDPQAAVISTIIGTDNLSVIVTTAEFQRGYVINISEEALNKLVGDFRTAIIEERDPQPAAQKLYDVLLKPLEKDLDAVQARTLVWSLDKFLRYVPVAALWDKDRGYLVQNYASVVLALASRQDLAFRPVRKDQWQALGVGVSKGAEGFSPLSSVPKELQAIVRESSSTPKQRELGMIAGHRLLDEQFTYDSFRKSLGSYPFTHAATHFKFIPGTKAEGLNSFLLLGNGEKLTLRQVQDSDNIFAGIELLTLSACDTGYGGKTADGREIEGFGVLAQRKGARAIMATLWPVDSESTRDFMIEFYGDYQKPNFNKAEALRQAQLALLQEPDRTTLGQTTKPAHALSKEFAHPYYWSPFILIGNWQ